MKNKIELEYVWKDRKRTFLGLPWSFTRYRLTNEKFISEIGFFTLHQEEMRLYRVMDLTLSRTLGQRIFNLGTITVRSSDKATPIFEIKNIKNSEYVKELFSKLVEDERIKKRVAGREMMIGDDGSDDVTESMDDEGIMEDDTVE